MLHRFNTSHRNGWLPISDASGIIQNSIVKIVDGWTGIGGDYWVINDYIKASSQAPQQLKTITNNILIFFITCVGALEH